MGKVKDFFKTWWRVMVIAIILLLELSAFGCAIYATETAKFFGVCAIFGSFIAVVLCVHLLIEAVNEAKRR